jgi:hypothetical protein
MKRPFGRAPDARDESRREMVDGLDHLPGPGLGGVARALWVVLLVLSAGCGEDPPPGPDAGAGLDAGTGDLGLGSDGGERCERGSPRAPLLDFVPSETEAATVAIGGVAGPDDRVTARGPGGTARATADASGRFGLELGLVEGPNRIEVVASGPCGGTPAAGVTVTRRAPDQAGPRLEWVSPGADAVASATVSLAVVARDPDGVVALWLSVDGSTLASTSTAGPRARLTASFDPRVDGRDGPRWLTAGARDGAGHVARSSRRLIADLRTRTLLSTPDPHAAASLTPAVARFGDGRLLVAWNDDAPPGFDPGVRRLVVAQPPAWLRAPPWFLGRSPETGPELAAQYDETVTLNQIVRLDSGFRTHVSGYWHHLRGGPVTGGLGDPQPPPGAGGEASASAAASGRALGRLAWGATVAVTNWKGSRPYARVVAVQSGAVGYFTRFDVVTEAPLPLEVPVSVALGTGPPSYLPHVVWGVGESPLVHRACVEVDDVVNCITWSPPRTVTSSAARSPRLAGLVDSTEAVLVWAAQPTGGGASAVFMRRIGLGPLGPVVAVGWPGSGLAEVEPDVAVSADGRVHVVWSVEQPRLADGRSGGRAVVHRSFADAEGADPSPIEGISERLEAPDGFDSAAPRIWIDGYGTCVVWQDEADHDGDAIPDADVLLSCW